MAYTVMAYVAMESRGKAGMSETIPTRTPSRILRSFFLKTGAAREHPAVAAQVCGGARRAVLRARAPRVHDDPQGAYIVMAYIWLLHI